MENKEEMKSVYIISGKKNSSIKKMEQRHVIAKDEGGDEEVALAGMGSEKVSLS